MLNAVNEGKLDLNMPDQFNPQKYSIDLPAKRQPGPGPGRPQLQQSSARPRSQDQMPLVALCGAQPDRLAYLYHNKKSALCP